MVTALSVEAQLLEAVIAQVCSVLLHHNTLVFPLQEVDQLARVTFLLVEPALIHTHMQAVSEVP